MRTKAAKITRQTFLKGTGTHPLLKKRFGFIRAILMTHYLKQEEPFKLNTAQAQQETFIQRKPIAWFIKDMLKAGIFVKQNGLYSINIERLAQVCKSDICLKS